jgi:hypothetical protein
LINNNIGIFQTVFVFVSVWGTPPYNLNLSAVGVMMAWGTGTWRYAPFLFLSIASLYFTIVDLKKIYDLDDLM